MSQFSARRPRAVAAPLRFETLEDRLTPSWGGVPPSEVALPTGLADVALNATGDVKFPRRDFDHRGQLVPLHRGGRRLGLPNDHAAE